MLNLTWREWRGRSEYFTDIAFCSPLIILQIQARTDAIECLEKCEIKEEASTETRFVRFYHEIASYHKLAAAFYECLHSTIRLWSYVIILYEFSPLISFPSFSYFYKRPSTAFSDYWLLLHHHLRRHKNREENWKIFLVHIVRLWWKNILQIYSIMLLFCSHIAMWMKKFSQHGWSERI